MRRSRAWASCRGQRLLDAVAGDLVAALDGVGVGLEEDGDAVPGPSRDQGGVYADSEPGGYCRVSEVVGALGERPRPQARSFGGAGVLYDGRRQAT